MPMRRTMTTLLILAALATAAGIYTDRRADLRAAEAEARFPAEGNIVTVDGRDVHVHVFGSGPDLVLIHGAGGSTRDMTSSIGRQLSDRFRVFAVDRPGLGWSDRSDPAYRGPFSTGFETPQEQARILSAAVSRLGAVNPLVAGHSYGGAVAMAWGLEHPASGIVIISGATMPWPGKVDPFYRVFSSTFGGAVLVPIASAFATKSYVDATLNGVFAPQSPPENYAARVGVPLAMRRKTVRANARQVNGLRPEIVQMSRRYGEITLPVEILHGSADQTVYTEVHAEPLHAALPNSTLTILDGIGHMPHHVASNQVIDAIDRAAMRAGLR